MISTDTLLCLLESARKRTATMLTAYIYEFSSQQCFTKIRFRRSLRTDITSVQLLLVGGILGRSGNVRRNVQ